MRSVASSRFLKHAGWTVAVSVLLWLLSSYAVAYKLTRRAAPRSAEPVPMLSWAEIEPAWLQTTDGEELGAWHVAGNPGRPTVVLLHGNGGQKFACLDEAEFLNAAGCGVLLVSLRAHGESSGDCNDFGYSARHDVIAAVDWLEDRGDAGPIVLWGQSLGAAAACFASGELGQRPCGYILECPYRDLDAAVWNRLQDRLPMGADWLAYRGLRLVAPLVITNVDDISPCNAAANLPPTMPVLLLAGDKDRRAPPCDAAAICERCGDRAKLVTFADGEHLQLERSDPQLYRESILRFLDRALRQ